MGHQNKSVKIKRWAIIACLVFFAGQLVLPAILMPHQAKAVLPVAESGPSLAKQIWQTIWDVTQKALKTAGDVAFKNVLRNYLNNLSYNFAVKLATGKQGQKPMFETSPQTLLQQAGDAAAGDLLDSLVRDVAIGGRCQQSQADKDAGAAALKCTKDSQCPGYSVWFGICPDGSKKPEGGECPGGAAAMLNSVETRGHCINSTFSLCDLKPQNVADLVTPKVKVQIWGRQYVEGAKPSIESTCPLSEIVGNAQDTYNLIYKAATRYEPTEGHFYLVDFAKNFNPESNELGMYITLQNETQRKIAEKIENTKFVKSLEGQFKSLTTTISGVVKTPSAFIQSQAESLVPESMKPYATYTGTAIADAVGVFTNTLASKLIDKYIFGKGFNPDATRPSSSAFASLSGGSSPGVSAAKITYAELAETNYVKSGDVDILSKLASCPDVNDRTPDTCVINSNFSSAIEQQMTVAAAIKAGLLDPNALFGYDANKRELDYKSGYPYRSLVILRKYRIIPVSWELAASYIRLYAQGSYSLQDLISKYDDRTSPFYHLIDVNWVLKAPQVSCTKQGAGEKIDFAQAIRASDTNYDNKVDTNDISTTAIQRADYCADEQSCIAEDENGKCLKYGYCIEEKPIWRFEGTACKAYNNTCQSMTSSNNVQVSYLKNTLDTNGCNSNNAGCQWYCKDYTLASDTWNCSAAGGDKINFNKTAEACKASAEGCQQLIAVAGSGANLVPNSSFETYTPTSDIALATDGQKDTAVPDEFPGWTDDGVDAAGNPRGLRLEAVSGAFNGSTAARLERFSAAGSREITSTIDTGHLTDQRLFTVSLYAKTDPNDADCAAAPGSITMSLRRQTNAGTQERQIGTVNVASDWTRFTGSGFFAKTVPADWASEFQKKTMTLALARDSSCNVIIDGVQVEEGQMTSYKDYQDSTKTYLKAPPDYLGCTGNAATDNAACNNFALKCSTDEVGCQLYTAKSTGETVTGIVSNPVSCDPYDPASCDQCPSQFVGCKAYRELPIDHTPMRPARDPVSFIASTGKSCSAAAVGCEEYTNLETVAQGGEGKEYYSLIRQCVPTTDANIATYYTWEGSDEFGYQLKSYQLKASNEAGGAPCTNMVAENPAAPPAGFGGNSWPACVDNVSFDENGDTVNEPHPAVSCIDNTDTCTVDTNADGTPDSCSNTRTSCTTNQDCVRNQLAINPDCSEFYDQAGNTHYRLKSKVIYASDQCKSYRNTVDGTAALYHMISGQSLSCPAAAAGCRAYKGNAGDNTRTIYQNTFENGTVFPWIGNVTYSNESVQVGGHSMLATNDAAYNNVGSTLGFVADASYTISFWAKSAVNADANITAGLDLPAPASDLIFNGQATARSGDWGRYELGPLYVPAGTALATVPLTITGNNAFYIDTITVKQAVDSIYAIKDSYTECSGYENCDQYTGPKNSVQYLKSFSRLCSPDKVGCEALIDTRNSNSPFSAKYPMSYANRLRGDANGDGTVDAADVGFLNAYLGGGPAPVPLEAGDADTNGVVNAADANYITAYVAGGPAPAPQYIYNYTVVPADTTVTLVNDPKKSCASSDKGCQKLGSPTLDQAGEPTDFTTTYLRNDPEQYTKMLCLSSEIGCNAYSTDEGGLLNFKDPGQKTCFYKAAAGTQSAGWYRTGSTSPVPDCPVVNGYCTATSPNAYKPCNDNTDCGTAGVCQVSAAVTPQPADGWVGLCPAEESGCTEIKDPENPYQCDVRTPGACTAYHYINKSVSGADCSGLVNRPAGCRLFDNTAAGALTKNSIATEDNATPADCPDPATCNSNTIIKVRPDRVCGKWLECQTSWKVKNAAGKDEDLCMSLAICNQLEEGSGQCTSLGLSATVNQTYNSPVFADQIKNASGLTKVGLDWGKRCDTLPTQLCAVDADCPGTNVGRCQTEIIDGYYPTSSMLEVGLGGVTGTGDLIRNGSFGDNDLTVNKLLSDWIAYNTLPSGKTTWCDVSTTHPWCTDLTDPHDTLPTPSDPLQLSAFSNWHKYNDSTILILGEEKADGTVPADGKGSPNLDENNILIAQTDSYPRGMQYNLASSIVKNQEYSLSFRIKSDAPGAQAIVQLGYGVSDANLANTSYFPGFGDRQLVGTISLTKDWQQFVYTFNGGGSSRGVVSENTILQFMRNSIGGTVNLYLDDVSLMPVLQVKSGTCVGGTSHGNSCTSDTQCPGGGVCQGSTKLARSCRMYPSTEAPGCTYTDDNNTTHRGWYGYCLDRDPQNTKYCIDWWPVDLLAGETNIFNNITAGYQGRAPLYMCVQAKGNSGRTGLDSTGNYIIKTRRGCETGLLCPNDDTHNLWGCAFTGFACSFQLFNTGYESDKPANTYEANLLDYDIDRIVLHVTNNDGHDDWPPVGADMVLDPNQTNNSSRFIDGTIADGQNPWEVLYCCDDSSGDCNVPCTGQDNPVTSTYSSWSARGNFQASCSHNNYEIAGIRANFTNHLFTGFSVGLCDGNNDLGGFEVEATFYLKEYCTELAQVVQSDLSNKAWAQRTGQSSNYSVISVVNDLVYRYTQDYAPFGGVIAPEGDNPTQWQWALTGGTGPLSVERRGTSQARAGSPYSCSTANGCLARRCSTGLNDCANKDQAAACYADAGNTGYCIGLGAGFCRDNAAIFCRAGHDEDCNIPPNNYGTCVATGGGRAISNLNITTNSSAITRLERLFALSFQAWSWQVNTGVYASDAATQAIWEDQYLNHMSQCAGNSRPAAPNDYCGVLPRAVNFSVGSSDQSSNSITITTAQILQLNFELRADENQLPIRQVWVDWGTGSPVPLTGPFGNGIITVSHFYTQPGTYRPRVQVQDNWGWCTDGSRYTADVQTCAVPADCLCSTGPNNWVQAVDKDGRQVVITVQ